MEKVGGKVSESLFPSSADALSKSFEKFWKDFRERFSRLIVIYITEREKFFTCVVERMTCNSSMYIHTREIIIESIDY